MKNTSIWLDTIHHQSCPTLNENKQVDILIVGGGLTGMSVAYHLRNSGKKVMLVEKNTIGRGITSRTTGKLTYLQEDIYTQLKKYHGIEKAKLYLQSQKDAIDIVKQIVEEHHLECDLKQTKSFVFTMKNYKKMQNEYELLKDIGIPVKHNQHAIYVSDTYVFHPLKYLEQLQAICIKDGIEIYEHTKIESMMKDPKGYMCHTNQNTIEAKQVVLALHYPYFITPFLMPFKAYIEKSYIGAYQREAFLPVSAINLDQPTISFRYQHNYLLLLTNSHNICVKDNDKANYQDLLNKNQQKPDYLWSNMDVMTSDLLPFIGSINKEKTLLIATGYNTWGMTNGSLAGKMIADFILKRENVYAELFNPTRPINKGKIMRFPLILTSNAYSFIKSKIRKKGKVSYEKRNGKKVAVYIDEQQKEHIVYQNCPHMGCTLLFNEIEKTWDCPCHGSRFDVDGHCIDGPSHYDISYRI